MDSRLIGRGSSKPDQFTKKFIQLLTEEIKTATYGKSISELVTENLEKFKYMACGHNYRHIDICKEERIPVIRGIDPWYVYEDRLKNALKAIGDQTIILKKKLVFEQRMNEDGSITSICRVED